MANTLINEKSAFMSETINKIVSGEEITDEVRRKLTNFKFKQAEFKVKVENTSDKIECIFEVELDGNQVTKKCVKKDFTS